MDSASPIDPSERIGTIDILRGVALFIVLTINTATEFRVSIFQQFLRAVKSTDPADQISEALVLALHTKGFILFSFLFGIGLAIQFDRLAGNDRRFILMVRRLFILLAIGVAHLFLIWNGDILTEYAIVGLAVLPLLYAPRWLLAAISAVSLALWLASPWLPSPVSFPDAAWIAYHVEQARQVYGSGSFMEILAFRIDEVRTIAPLHVYVLPRTFGLFLLGAWVWRTGFFRSTAPRGALAAAACIMLAFGAWMTVAAARGDALGWYLHWQGRALFQSPAQLPSVDLRHQCVCQHRIVRNRPGHHQRFLGIFDGRDLVADLLDVTRRERPDRLFVIDDQDVRLMLQRFHGRRTVLFGRGDDVVCDEPEAARVFPQRLQATRRQ